MATVFKRGNRWVAKFKGPRGLWKSRSCGDADKARAQRLAAAWEAEALDTREGRIDPKAATFRDFAALPIADHIEAFRAMLTGKGNTARHVGYAVRHVTRVAELGRIKNANDLTPGAVRTAIASIRADGRSLRTLNAFLRSVKTFSRWMEADGRIRRDEIRFISGFNEATDKRHVRRALEADELARIIDATATGPAWRLMSGPDRAWLYRVACCTGFRVTELGSLTPSSFKLGDKPPVVVLAAGSAKNRQETRQPLPTALVESLATWMGKRKPGKPCWPGRWKEEAAPMLRRDMRRAKARWIREALNPDERRERRDDSFLDAVDDAGRIVDFHALRVSFITGLVRGGASVKQAQTLARHANVNLTLGVYTKLTVGDVVTALDVLPDVAPKQPEAEPEAERLRATGTDGKPVDGLHQICTKSDAIHNTRTRRNAKLRDGQPEISGGRKSFKPATLREVTRRDATRNDAPRVTRGDAFFGTKHQPAPCIWAPPRQQPDNMLTCGDGQITNASFAGQSTPVLTFSLSHFLTLSRSPMNVPGVRAWRGENPRFGTLHCPGDRP